MSPQDLDREVSQKLAEYLAEITLEKREARARASTESSKTSRWDRFWKWWAEYGASFSTIVTIISVGIGAGWTAKQYFDQERLHVEQQKRESDLERQKAIISFAGDLSEPDKRNGAAYALAVLGGKEALPLLTQHLVAATKSEADFSFREALTQAFITIGEDSLPEMIRLNREAAESGEGLEQSMILATQPVILHFLRHRVPSLVESGPKLAGISLAGVKLPNMNLSYMDLDDVNLSNMRLGPANLCEASLQRVDLSGTIFLKDVELGRANLQGAMLDRSIFFGGDSVSLKSANLTAVRGQGVWLEHADMRSVALVEGVLKESNFRAARLEEGDLRAADLTQSDFSEANLYRARLNGAKLVNVDFRKADLEGADLSNADLAGALFSDPYLYTLAAQAPRGGARVLKANLQGARNINRKTLDYLCRFGASNVPGGCTEIAVAKIPTILRLGGGSSCY
jgi:uncharacterized protein YjbI with pentapeptide repeats